MRKEALLYEKLPGNLTHCYLCSHQCKIAEEKFGFCGVRQNIKGTLYTHVYAEVIAAHTDPVEKKPLYHFLPGTSSFSIATIGCNFHCSFCQNFKISQASLRDSSLDYGERLLPEDVVRLALENHCKSISYTYTEPTIFFEYALDIAKIAKSQGLFNIFVTNGYMTKPCLEMIRPYLDAANVDLKFFKDSSYKKICAASLEPVLNSIRLMHELGIWVEVTTLIIPGENDSEQELRGIAEFIAHVDKNIPWHISRFHPDYKFVDYQMTSEKTLNLSYEFGKSAGLKFIYIGNVSGFGSDTFCPQCNKLVVERDVFTVLNNYITNGQCSFCQAYIPGVFSG